MKRILASSAFASIALSVAFVGAASLGGRLTGSSARLLSIEELETLSGGGCNQHFCFNRTCTTGGCPVTTTLCSTHSYEGQNYCMRISKSNFQVCEPHDDEWPIYYNCSTTSSSGCAQVYLASLVDGECPTPVCGSFLQRCGAIFQTCSETPCDD